MDCSIPYRLFLQEKIPYFSGSVNVVKGEGTTRRRRFGTPTFRPAFEEVPMMQQPVEQGAHCGNIS